MKSKYQNNYILFLLLTIIFSLFVSIFFLKNRKEGMESNDQKKMQKSVELVVARYNEDLNWMKQDQIDKYSNVTIYNKGKNQDFYHKPSSKIVTIDNVGRCDHTYLYHIIQNYDHLADIVAFLPGSADMGFKVNQTQRLFDTIEREDKAAFVNTRTFQTPLRDVYNDFQLDEWKASDTRNTEINSESKLEPSKYRPYGAWYDHYLKDTKAYTLSFYGIFSVAKEDIQQHPKSYYENLIKELSNSSNPEVGHYFERSWVAIFGPLHRTILVPEYTNS